MFKHRILLCSAAAAATAVGTVAHAQSSIHIAPTSAISFQDEGTLTVDDTLRLIAQDGIYGPTVTGTVTHDAYATGSSDAWFDAISLTFDLAAAGINYLDINGATLEFYVRDGTSGGWQVHSYQVQSGAFNTTNQDANPAGTAFNLPDGGLLSQAIDVSAFTSSTFNVTLRLWEVNVDMVRLSVTVIPAPGAAAALGLAGVAGLRRRRR